VRRAALDGTGFTTIHDSADGGGRGVYEDGEGTLFTTGVLTASPVPHTVTRRSTDAGVSWEQIDEYSYVAGIYAGALSADEQGNVFQSGIGIDQDGVYHWVVRKLACR
jgi:hypothetical protein